MDSRTYSRLERIAAIPIIVVVWIIPAAFILGQIATRDDSILTQVHETGDSGLLRGLSLPLGANHENYVVLARVVIGIMAATASFIIVILMSRRIVKDNGVSMEI